MLLARCGILGREVLIWASDLEGIINTDDGMVVRYRCACGELAETLAGPHASVTANLHLGVPA
jgi:hypothetical protein